MSHNGSWTTTPASFQTSTLAYNPGLRHRGRVSYGRGLVPMDSISGSYLVRAVGGGATRPAPSVGLRDRGQIVRSVMGRSPLKVKEDDEVDKLEIKLAVTRKSNRIYQSTSPEVISKISRSLRSLNAKTGLFSKRMKIIHKDPILHAQRLAAIKKAKRTDAARKQASEAMKTFFSNPENRLKRSIAMKGVKFFCRCCGDEGHRSHYCPTVLKASGELRFKCRLCGERGHNRRTCGRSQSNGEEKAMKRSSFRHCRACGRSGHNRRTCSEVTQAEIDGLRTHSQKDPSSTNRKRTYSCKLCSAKGHNIRTCPERKSR